MIISMTGYGRGTANSAGDRITAEVKVLNSRYLDLKLRGLEIDPELELKLSDRIRNNLIRGSVVVSFSFESDNGKLGQLKFNRERFESIEKILISIQREYGRQIDMSDILTGSDLFTEGDVSHLNHRIFNQAVDKALLQVENMRKREGKILQEDIADRLTAVKNMIDDIEQFSESSVDDRKTRLEIRLKDIIGNVKLDENRIYQEIAILADKFDISEEITRFRSHIEQCNAMFEIDEPVGKRLNFLLQEIGREINTIGSKSNQVAITKIVVDIKDQLEKIREQVQNIL
ncbi:MAG: YicC family protein [Candidatus Marinimicrobia bacterium]|nr:YicC family protein [Candidatus Neomarinimicrobiota bacterium]